jgi:hypothetical protein
MEVQWTENRRGGQKLEDFLKKKFKKVSFAGFP